MAILDVPGLGSVNYIPPNWLEVKSSGDVVEWDLLSGNQYTRGEYIQAGQSMKVPIPHWKTFILTIGRHDKIGWILARENDAHLAFIAEPGPGKGINVGSNQVLLNLPGVGKVIASGPGNKVKLEREKPLGLGNVIEWSLESGGSYKGGEVMGNEQSEFVELPHYTTFTLTIARPFSGRIGAIHGRENDSIIGFTSATATNKIQVGSNGELLEVSRIGKVTASGPRNKVTTKSLGEFVEWSYRSGGQYFQDEGIKEKTSSVMPDPLLHHYQTFHLTISRPILGLIGNILGRENDGQIVFIKNKIP